MRPVVSIVLPVYNGARHLRQAIESCLAQSYRELELIIVDDGSTDATPAVIQECAEADPRVRVLTHGQNRGLPPALNTGFASASGEYLTWTSADNFYRPHALATMVRALESDPMIGLVYADYTVLDEDDKFLEYRTVGPTPDLLFRNVIGACFLYRRKVQEAVGPYDDDLVLAEDYDFWLRASASFGLTALHEDLYCCRDHRESLSVRHAVRAEANAIRCLDRNLRRLPWPSRSEKAAAYVQLARRAQLSRDWRAARRYLMDAFRVSPLHALIFVVRRISGMPNAASPVPKTASPNHTSRATAARR